MNSGGIDVPKRTSMIAVMRPSGEEGVSPIENQHTDGELSLLRGLPRETCVVMESTGNYHLPVAWLLNASGFYVSVVSAALAHDYGNNLSPQISLCLNQAPTETPGEAHHLGP